MILINPTFAELAEQIKHQKKRIVVYGAGVIGQVTVSNFIKRYNLFDELIYFVDMDKQKQGQQIKIKDRSYKILSPDHLATEKESIVLMITNSKFFPVVEFLDGIEKLDKTTACIVPIVQIRETRLTEDVELEKYNSEPLIPKTINYCWFGGKDKPDFLKKCIESWYSRCPDYVIREWNEQNYDISRHAYTKEAYDASKYGFVTDVARLDILYENGGFYFDTDVELLRSLEDFRYQKGFVAVEKWGNINSGGGCGFVKGHPVLEHLIDYREKYHFVLSDGKYNIETNGLYETKFFMEDGYKSDNTLQVIDDVTIYPSYVFHPYDYMSGEIDIRHSTLSVHHFYGGWMEENDKLNREHTKQRYEQILRRMANN